MSHRRAAVFYVIFDYKSPALFLLLIANISMAQTVYFGITGAGTSNTQGLRYGISAGLNYSHGKTWGYDAGIYYTHKGTNLKGESYNKKAMSKQLNCIEMPVMLTYSDGDSKIGIGTGICVTVQSRDKYKMANEMTYIYKNFNSIGFDFPIYVKAEKRIGKFVLSPMVSVGTVSQWGQNKTLTGCMLFGYRF